jgi:hypothetical protein
MFIQGNVTAHLYEVKICGHSPKLKCIKKSNFNSNNVHIFKPNLHVNSSTVKIMARAHTTVYVGSTLKRKFLLVPALPCSGVTKWTHTRAIAHSVQSTRNSMWFCLCSWGSSSLVPFPLKHFNFPATISRQHKTKKTQNKATLVQTL